MTALLRLYPRDWRDRYEDEFLSLLSERQPDTRDRFDILRGAIDARLHPQVRKAGGDPIPDAPGRSIPSRAIGWLTLLGAVVWLAALVVMINGPIVVNEHGTYRDGMAAVPVAFLAFVLLSAGVIVVVRSLPDGSDGAGMAGAVAAVAGAVWILAPWVIWMLIIAAVGYVILALAARRAGVWRTADAVILIGGLALAAVFAVSGIMGIGATDDVNGYLPFWISLSSLWIAVGHSLIAPARSHATEEPATGD